MLAGAYAPASLSKRAGAGRRGGRSALAEPQLLHASARSTGTRARAATKQHLHHLDHAHLPKRHPRTFQLVTEWPGESPRLFRRLQRLRGWSHGKTSGVQYLSIRYTERLAEAGIERSVGSVGDSYDNALAESVNGL